MFIGRYGVIDRPAKLEGDAKKHDCKTVFFVPTLHVSLPHAFIMQPKPFES